MNFCSFLILIYPVPNVLVWPTVDVRINLYISYMRKLFVVLLTAVVICGLWGCQKATSLGNAASGSGDQDSGSFRVTIDGKPWVAIDSARSVSIMNGAITISGISSDDQNIVLSLTGAGAGTYVLGSGSKSVAAWTDSFMYLQDFSTIAGNASQASGQVVVSQVDAANQTISGTFQMRLYSDSAQYTKIFTNGVFNKLPYITSLPLAPATDTFTVLINGVPWTAPSITANIEEGEFMVRGSTPDGRQWVNIGVPVPASVGQGVIGYYCPVGLSSAGLYFGQYSNNDSVYLSSHYAPDPQYGGYYVYEDSGYLEILQNNLSSRRLSANFKLQVTDSTGVASVLLSNGYFSITY
jgi:Family of unknown function (DUF6252)